MKYINNAMKQLQAATEKLGNLNESETGPWGPLHQMQQVFNQDFWQNIHQLASMAQSQKPDTNPYEPTRNTSTQPKREQPTTQPPISPRLDLFETLGRVIVTLDLAGLDRNSLKLSVSDGTVLNLMGKIRTPDLSKYLIQQERKYGKFSRRIPLPSSVLSDGVKTTYKDGILEIHLMKKSTQHATEVNHLDVQL